MDYWGFMFAIFFVTLGPLKTIPVFYMLISLSSYAKSDQWQIREDK